MRKSLLIAMCLAALLAAFLLGRASAGASSPGAHIEWLKATGSIGAITNSPERADALMSAAEEKIKYYVGVAMPAYYIEWRGWVFVVVMIQPVAGAPLTEYRVLAYREIEGEWELLDEWVWFTDVRY